MEAQPLAVGGEGVHRGVFRTPAAALGTTVLVQSCHWDSSSSRTAGAQGQRQPSETRVFLLLHLPGRGTGVGVRVTVDGVNIPFGKRLGDNSVPEPDAKPVLGA